MKICNRDCEFADILGNCLGRSNVIWCTKFNIAIQEDVPCPENIQTIEMNPEDDQETKD